jgi:histidinol-phosphate aminotransferase
MSVNSLIASVFRPEVRAMSAYKVADADGLIKLDAMENPYQWPQLVKQQWLQLLQDCPLNRYPDPAARRLTQRLRQVNHISSEFGLLLGNGSDEIILLLLMALKSDACILAPEPSFVMYKQLSQSLGLAYQGIPLSGKSFDLDLPAMLAAIEQYQPAIIFLAYPNNPTGNLFNISSIEQMIEASSGLVVIDEAYTPFARTSFAGSLGRYPNLLIMRTLSKLGLAGLRLGYLAGAPEIIAELDKIRLPYNINSLTQLSADFALTHQTLFDQQTEQICAERTRLTLALERLDGLITYPSAANFILFKTPENQASRLFELIKAQGVLIKNLSPQGGMLADCLRVTVGKPEENDAFLSALRDSLKGLETP